MDKINKPITKERPLHDIQVIEELALKKARELRLEVGMLFWISPFNTIEHKMGYFDNNFDCVEWLDWQKARYDDMKISYFSKMGDITFYQGGDFYRDLELCLVGSN